MFGPVLFIIYINTIMCLITNCNPHLYVVLCITTLNLQTIQRAKLGIYTETANFLLFSRKQIIEVIVLSGLDYGDVVFRHTSFLFIVIILFDLFK